MAEWHCCPRNSQKGCENPINNGGLSFDNFGYQENLECKESSITASPLNENCFFCIWSAFLSVVLQFSTNFPVSWRSRVRISGARVRDRTSRWTPEDVRRDPRIPEGRGQSACVVRCVPPPNRLCRAGSTQRRSAFLWRRNARRIPCETGTKGNTATQAP